MPARPQRLNPAILVSNLASGVCWLLPVAVGAWPVAVLGAAYVVIASLGLARIDAAGIPSSRQRVRARLAVWFGAVATWGLVIVAVEYENALSHYLVGLSVGLLYGTLSFLGWQLLALTVRQALPGLASAVPRSS